jgi:hypothetical protein
MASGIKKTFIVDCHICKAKVAATEDGRSERTEWIEEIAEPWGVRVLLGSCPSCNTILVGHSSQREFKGYDGADDNAWSDVVRVFPKPTKAFSSYRIPSTVTDSLVEADRSLQANANIAACVMLGRALEALCRDVLARHSGAVISKTTKTKKVMLASGIQQLREKKVIDDRLYDWSQQLAAFRNLAAHPEDISISRKDAEDLQTFVYAIVEYIYDLADRYEEFKARTAKTRTLPTDLI